MKRVSLEHFLLQPMQLSLYTYGDHIGLTLSLLARLIGQVAGL